MRPTPPAGPADASADAAFAAALARAVAAAPDAAAPDAAAPGTAAPDAAAPGTAAPDAAAPDAAILDAATVVERVYAAIVAGSRKPAPTWRRKVGYHHRDLRASALARGREIVGLLGPTGLTLRGLARDLGVSPAALVHVFGRVAYLREAVAASVLEELGKATGTEDGEKPEPRDVAAPWIDFATRNPNLYRLACGEGWHLPPGRPSGVLGTFATLSPRRYLERALWKRTRRLGKPKGDPERARRFASAIHGLALARIDGMPERDVAQELERLLA